MASTNAIEVTERERIHELFQQAPPWYKNPGLRKLYFLLIAALLTSSSWGFDLSMTNGLQSVDGFMNNFGNPKGATLGFYGACMSVGGIIGTIISGPLVDRLGRKPVCAVGAAIIIGMAIMETWAKSFYMFAGAKLVLGLGANLQQVSGPVLVTELAHPKDRVALTSFYNTSIFLGLMIGAWITFGTFQIDSNWSWKIPCILQITLPTYQVIMIWFLPESPRWYVTKGRLEEARQILIKYHGNGKENDIVRAEMQEMIAGVEADKTLIKFNKEGILSILGTKGNRHRLWIALWTAVGSQCAGSSLISLYLPQILNQVGLTTSREKTLINGVLRALVIARVSRRKVFLVCTGGMLICFIIWTAMAAEYLKTNRSSYGIAVVIMIFLFSFFSSACWIPLVITYPLEIVTAKQRGIFFAWAMFAINASSFAVSYVNPVALENLSWRYYIIQIVFDLALLLIIYFTFVETRGLTLEEVATVFDGDETFNEAAAAIGVELEKKAARIEVENHEGSQGDLRT